MELTPWSGERLELGEGARWVGGRLVLVDLLAGRLLTTDGVQPGELREVRRLDVPLGAVAPVAGRPGEWLAATGTGVEVLHVGGGRTAVAALPGPAAQPYRVNDAVADPHGRFWVGTMTYVAVPGAGTLFRIVPGEAPVAAVTGLTIPNGPAFSGDGRTMYLADTTLGEIDRFAVDPATGELHGREPFARLAPGEGLPDGMTVDAAGHLWVALWGGSAVRRYRPDGVLDRELRLPARQPTSVCLGGPGMRRLYIASANIGLESPGPLDGALFAVDVETRGTEASAVIWTDAP
ncbi:SMP-30/gluconolactonase/LRE family protein [Dactylosporangium sp. NPDC005572]|uniref:SMP-30/gluconolactonase/LRE family protein n=1 Tax=Dactylosporangium sp. NPDC005572 TaxID=3156889 RepID=UPI0033B4FEE1